MKKIIIAILACILLLCTGCGQETSSTISSETTTTNNRVTETTRAISSTSKVTGTSATTGITVIEGTVPDNAIMLGKYTAVDSPRTAATMPKSVEWSTKNVAKGCAVKADFVQGDYLAEYACDGKADTRWSAYDSDRFDHWIVVDLGKKVDIQLVYISFEALSSSYKLFLSDSGEDGSWNEIYDKKLNITSAKLNAFYDVAFENASGRFLKLQCYMDAEDIAKFSGAAYFSIYEIEVNIDE